MDLKDILENKDLADTLPVRVGDVEIPLGSLRQATTAQLAAITERARQLDTREQTITARQKEIVDLASKAQDAYAKAQELAKTAAATRTPEPGADLFSDPWAAQFKPVFDGYENKIKDLNGKLDRASGMLTEAAKTWAEDRWDNEYGSIQWGKRDKEKQPSRDELLKYAMDNKLMDRRGMPSIKLAWEKQTEVDRLADAADKARQEGIEQGRREAMAARIPPPGVPGAPPPPPNKNADRGDLGDLYAESLKDPELRALIESLPPGIV